MSFTLFVIPESINLMLLTLTRLEYKAIGALGNYLGVQSDPSPAFSIPLVFKNKILIRHWVCVGYLQVSVKHAFSQFLTTAAQ